MAEEENRTLKNEKSEVFSEKEVMEEELRLTYARISELESFIDGIKLGRKLDRGWKQETIKTLQSAFDESQVRKL